MTVPLSRTIQYMRSQLRSFRRFLTAQETAVHKNFEMAEDIKNKLATCEVELHTLQEASALQQRSLEYRKSHNSTIIFDRNKLKYMRRALFKAREEASTKDDKDGITRANRMLDLMDDLDLYINDSPVFVTYRSAFKNLKGNILDGDAKVPERTAQIIAQTKILRRLIDGGESRPEDDQILPETLQTLAKAIIINRRITSVLQAKRVTKEKTPPTKLLRGTAIDDEMKNDINTDLADDDFFDDP
ncbi:hypothetical protein GL50803_0011982 [Giardia duodenalis]|uniref:Uncharacterized protein n=2 Tax=Giardia intestinalis TaxID=5741 RepID=A8BZ32_GIAIC|nr:hypothetical protein GL50803_0011982 [Giardia intestinalis]ESU35338.1 Hypothetical protein DHA2_11982 [Giardia intestinalis]KAE8301690.1 hypothetical protein GL50803_0011982 [Giardia intestinalis]|eukprot:XP_001704074.1 Hypothetical protein GL50803_11982 [Giardia lamblia ATCC 50803]